MPSVLILGATSDIGFATAKKFASEQYTIQLAGRNPEALQPLQSDIQIRYGVQCQVYAFDAMDFDSHAAFYNGLQEKPEIVICVVGYMNDNEKVINSQEETLRTLHTNYTGPVNILNIIAADFSQSKKGTIVGISSVAGLRGRQSNYIYGSAKAGFTAYLSGLRNKLYHSGIHVVTVLPGFVNTKMTADLNLPKLLTAQPEDVARVIYTAVKKKKNIVYVKWFWRWIMCIIVNVPEFIFKKKKL
jgi:decaprenylphospho-beta-D-erythro-pentofuranosid-2-ulose 2-reductase